MSVSYINGANALTCAPATVRTALGPVEYTSCGEGPAVIALHGGMGGLDQSLLLAGAAIGVPEYRIIAISRPGYLGTPLASGRTPEEQAALCAALLDELRIGQAGIISVSAGGLCAIQFALRHQKRCWGLVMVSAVSGHHDAPPEVSRRLGAIKALTRVPFLMALMRWRVTLFPQAVARRSIPDPDLCRRTLKHPEAGPLMIALLASTFARLPERLPGTLNDIAQLDAAAAYPLEEIALPVLAIHGTGDRLVPFSHAARVASMVPGSELMAIEGGEHVSLFTHLDAVRACANAFVAKHAKE